MAKLISDLGSSGQALAYLTNLQTGINASPSWQHSTYLLLQNEYGAGMLLAILRLISGGSIIQLTYLPIPGMLSICMVYLIMRKLAKLVDTTLSAANLSFSIVAIVAMYVYTLQNVIGRFYAFDFHAINNALYLMCLYFLIRMSEPERSSAYFLTFILAFSASNIIHYTVPIELIGALAAYVVLSWFASRPRKIYRLPLLLVAISSLQSFYFSILNRTNILQVPTSLLQYFSGDFMAPTQGSTLSLQFLLQILLEKAYTYSSAIFVLAITVALFRIRGEGKTGPMASAYSLTVGSGIAYSVAYFAYYGHGNFGFVDGWLLQPLLIVSIVMIWARQRSETKTTFTAKSTATFDRSASSDSSISRAGEKNGQPRTLRRAVLAALLVVALLQATAITLETNETLFHGPLIAEPRLESAHLQSFSISHLSGGRFLIGASSEVSSALYSHLADYNDSQVLTVIPAYVTGNSIFTNNTLLTYAELRDNFNFLIMTKYELSNGLYGGATPEQTWEYLNATEVINLKSILDSNQNLVYNSGQAYLYAFN